MHPIGLSVAMLLPIAVFSGAASWSVPVPSLTAAPAKATLSLQAMDREFVCPETMQSDADRMASLHAFFTAYASEHPGNTPTQMLEYRRILLIKHHCAQTLKRIRAADKAVEDGEVEVQAWLPIGKQDGASLSMSTNHNLVTLDARFANEKSVAAYARLKFDRPGMTTATHMRYDMVISHSIYLCQSHRYILEDNTYFLNGRRVIKDEGEIVGQSKDGKPVYAVNDVPDGSVNEDAWHWACEVAQGQVS